MSVERKHSCCCCRAMWYCVSYLTWQWRLRGGVFSFLYCAFYVWVWGCDFSEICLMWVSVRVVLVVLSRDSCYSYCVESESQSLRVGAPHYSNQPTISSQPLSQPPLLSYFTWSTSSPLLFYLVIAWQLDMLSLAPNSASYLPISISVTEWMDG